MLKNFKQHRPEQWTTRQTDYVSAVIRENSFIKSVIEVGTGSGSVVEAVWTGIHDTGKQLHTVDAYYFLPKPHRQKFGESVINSIGNQNSNLKFILADSKQFPWNSYDVLISSHEDSNHFDQDWQRFCKDPGQLQVLVIDLNMHCGQRFMKMIEIMTHPPKAWQLSLYVDGLVMLSQQPLQCSLPLETGQLFNQQFQFAPKRDTTMVGHQKELARTFQKR